MGSLLQSDHTVSHRKTTKSVRDKRSLFCAMGSLVITTRHNANILCGLRQHSTDKMWLNALRLLVSGSAVRF